MMRPRQVVDAVRWVMDGLIREKAQSAAIAHQYAELVAEARRRSAECLSLLRQGSRLEARELAQRQPQLLDVLAVLHDRALERWPEFCKRHGLADPPSLSMREVEELLDGMRTLEKLEPILDEWRIQNLRRDPAHVRLQTLWRLVRADPSSPAWRDDALRFEESALRELGDSYSRSLALGKFEECWRMQGFAARPNWKTPSALTMARKWESELQALVPRTAHDRASEVARLLHERFLEQDLAGAREQAQQFAALRFFLSDSGMPLAGNVAAEADAAISWIEQQQRDEERRRDGLARLAALQALLGLQTATREQLEEALRGVESAPPDEPWDDEQLAASSRIHQFVAQERRARAVRWLSAVAAILTIGAFVAWGIMSYRATEHAGQVAERILVLIEQGQLEDADQHLASARELGLDHHDVVRHAADELARARASRGEDERRFEVLLVEAGDPAAARARVAAIDEAERLVVTVAQRERISTWRADYAAAGVVRQRERDVAFGEQVKALSDGLTELSRLDPDAGGASERLSAFEAQCRALQSQRDISPPTTEALGKARDKLERLSTEWAALRKERTRSRDRDAGFAKLLSAAASPATYAEALVDFASEWPEDPRAKECRSAAGDLAAWEILTDWTTRMQPFAGRPLPTSPTERAALQNAVSDHLTAHPLTPFAARPILALLEPAQPCLAWIESLAQQPAMSLGQIRLTNGATYYVRRNLPMTGRTGATYIAAVVTSVDTLDVPERQPFPLDQIAFDGESPQAAMAARVMAFLSKSPSDDPATLIQLWKLAAMDESLDPLVRLMIAEGLASCLRGPLSSSSQLWDAFEKAAADAAVAEADWIAQANASSESARRRATQALRSAPTPDQLGAHLAASRAEATRSLGSSYQPVGRVIRSGSGRVIEWLSAASQSASRNPVAVVSRTGAVVVIVPLGTTEGRERDQALDGVSPGALVFEQRGGGFGASGTRDEAQKP